MDYLRQTQADIMLVLVGICGVIALLIFLTDTMSAKQKRNLILLECSAMFLMIADRRAYIFRGDPSPMGWWMVRLSNFLVFFLILVIIYSFNRYLEDLLTTEGKMSQVPRRLKVAGFLTLAGMVLVIISQFTGLYYTFDSMNRYQRAPGFIVSYLIPFSVLILQLSAILKYSEKLTPSMRRSLLFFSIACIIASVLQVFLYGISLNNLTIVAMSALLFVFTLQDMTKQIEHARMQKINFYREAEKKEHAMFEQTAEALANAIDAKDKYTRGHSSRVAQYSLQIARAAGKNDEECEKIYFAALLHDMGKIGVKDYILNKEGKLTPEEFAEIKMHPVYGNQILSSIQQSPYLSIGAHYHHERYDGKGYPDGLKGEDIPEYARIIAVADSYDAMTSKRSYRDPLPQQIVREELVKGQGAQFDPVYAKIMLQLLDKDTKYQLREETQEHDETFIRFLHCESIYHNCTIGFQITEQITRIRLFSKADPEFSGEECLPSLVLFDALDARVHEDPARQRDLLYLEYGLLRFDGRTQRGQARKIQTRILSGNGSEWAAVNADNGLIPYEIEAVRFKDHGMIRISDGHLSVQSIIAFPDSTRFSYFSLTGEHCTLSNIRVDSHGETITADYIPRIAEEISHIAGMPEGDIPNVQIDGWRTEATSGIPVEDQITLTFHTKSLPTARLIWHCPFVVLYSSANGEIGGEEYREYLLLRLDGENWDSDSHVENSVEIHHTQEFKDWNTWKAVNQAGMDCTVSIRRDENTVMVSTQNQGIALSSVTVIKDDPDCIYAALTGDQVALTNIRISRTEAVEAKLPPDQRSSPPPANP